MEDARSESPAPPTPLAALAKRYRRVLLGPFFMALLAAQMLTALAWFGPALFYRTDLTFPEGAVAARALAVAQGESAYADWRIWPHQFAPYGPLTYYPAGWAARALGKAHDPMALYTFGRLQSLASLTAIMFLMLAMLRRHKMGWGWAALAILIFFDWPYQVDYIFSYRPDAPKTALALAALALMEARAPRRGSMAAVMALLWLSFWFKPTAWGFALTAAAWVAHGRGAKAAAGWLAAFGLGGLVTSFALDRAMDGRLYLNMVASLQNGVSLDVLREFARRILSLPMLLMAVMAGVSIRTLAREKTSAPGWLTMTAFLLTLGLALAQCLKVGADLNYLADPFLLACLLAAGLLRRLWQTANSAPAPSGLRAEAALWALMAALLVFECPAIARSTGDSVRIIGGMARDRALPTFFEAKLPPNALILASKPSLPLFFGTRQTVMDRLQYRLLGEQGALDRAPLRQRVQAGGFDAIAIETYYFEPDYWKGMREGRTPELFYPGFFADVQRHYAQDPPQPGYRNWTLWRPRNQAEPEGRSQTK